MQAQEEEVAVLVKAIPNPSNKYSETVCCAGLDRYAKWRRLYPVRFRQLANDKKFQRWQWVKFNGRQPERDYRVESRAVEEESITPLRKIKRSERSKFLEPAIFPSAKSAAEAGHSLTLIRPQDFQFLAKKRNTSDLDRIREGYQSAARQMSFLDQELAAFEPVPFDFRVRFKDEAGHHEHSCTDWETTAAYRKWELLYGSEEAIERLSSVYNDEYASKGIVLALGNMLSRPQTWLMLGILRVDNENQISIPL